MFSAVAMRALVTYHIFPFDIVLDDYIFLSVSTAAHDFGIRGWIVESATWQNIVKVLMIVCLFNRSKMWVLGNGAADRRVQLDWKECAVMFYRIVRNIEWLIVWEQGSSACRWSSKARWESRIEFNESESSKTGKVLVKQGSIWGPGGFRENKEWLV